MLISITADYKSGKTVSAATFIDACKNPDETILFLDIDVGFSSVQNARRPDGSLVVPRWKEIMVIPLHRHGYKEFHFITASKEDFKKHVDSTPPYTDLSVELMNKMNSIFAELYASQGKYNGKKIQALVIDSASGLFRIWKDSIINVNKIPSLRINDYATIEGVLFSQFIPMLKGLLPYIPWIIVTNHVTMEKDEVTGAISEFPVGPSSNQGRLMGKEFDEVWKMGHDGSTYTWRTKSTGFFRAGSRLSLPDPVKPAEYKRLEEILTSRATKERG